MKIHKDKDEIIEVNFDVVGEGEDEDGEFVILELTPKNKGEKHDS